MLAHVKHSLSVSFLSGSKLLRGDIFVDKHIYLKPGCYFFKEKFVMRVSYKNTNEVGYLVYNKFENGQCKDFVCETKSLPHLSNILNILNEKFNDEPIIKELDPEYNSI